MILLQLVLKKFLSAGIVRCSQHNSDIDFTLVKKKCGSFSTIGVMITSHSETFYRQ